MIPLNCLSHEKWANVLSGSYGRFTAYPWINTGAPSDFRSWTSFDIRLSAMSMTDEIAKNPAGSVSTFLDRGFLPRHISPTVPTDPLHPLMPLRGWLRDGPMLRSHGSAWLLHLAVRSSQDGATLWRSARVWLLETCTGADAHLEVI